MGRCDNASRLFVVFVNADWGCFFVLVLHDSDRLRLFLHAYSAKASKTALFAHKKVRMITCTTHTSKVRQIAQKRAKIGFILCAADRTCKGEAA